MLQFGCHCHHHGDSLNSHPFPFQRPSTSWALPALSSQSGVSLLVLICIWLIANHVNYLSVCLPPVCVSFLGDVCLPLCPLCCHTVYFSLHHFVADPCVSLRPVRCGGMPVPHPLTQKQSRVVCFGAGGEIVCPGDRHIGLAVLPVLRVAG